MKWVIGLISFLLMIAAPVAVMAESEEICCTWVNPNYTSANPPQKEIRNIDGTFANYITLDATDPLRRGTFTIFKKWKDAEGNIWYRIKRQGSGGAVQYELAKISANGKTLEVVIRNEDFPSRLNPALGSYRRYTRYYRDR